MEINTEEYRKYKPDKDDKEAESCEDRGTGHYNEISKMFCGGGEENNLKKRSCQSCLQTRVSNSKVEADYYQDKVDDIKKLILTRTNLIRSMPLQRDISTPEKTPRFSSST